MQRGRVSKEAQATVVVVDGTPPPLTPPDDLSKAEQTLFREIIASCKPTHFVTSDLPLLISFVQATVMARNAAKKDIAVWEKSVRIQAMLATRLRLAPQSRMTHRTAARQQGGYQGPKPWDIRG